MCRKKVFRGRGERIDGARKAVGQDGRGGEAELILGPRPEEGKRGQEKKSRSTRRISVKALPEGNQGRDREEARDSENTYHWGETPKAKGKKRNS